MTRVPPPSPNSTGAACTVAMATSARTAAIMERIFMADGIVVKRCVLAGQAKVRVMMGTSYC